MNPSDWFDPTFWSETANINLVAVVLIVVISQYAKLIGLPRGWPRRIPPAVLSLALGWAMALSGVEPVAVLPAGAPLAARVGVLSALHLAAALALYWLGEERLRRMLPKAFNDSETQARMRAADPPPEDR